MKPLEFKIRRSFFDSANRQLIISVDSLKFENKDLANDAFTVFKKEEIRSFRYGINWIQYIVNFGREFIIEVKNDQEKIIKINFTSYFGRHLHSKHSFYAQIINGLWDFYFEDIIRAHLEAYESGEEIKIGNNIIDKSGIRIKTGNIISQKETMIPWQEVGTKNYPTYYSIYSKTNPGNINRGYSYKEDWNTGVLFSIIEKILNDKSISN